MWPFTKRKPAPTPVILVLTPTGRWVSYMQGPEICADFSNLMRRARK